MAAKKPAPAPAKQAAPAAKGAVKGKAKKKNAVATGSFFMIGVIIAGAIFLPTSVVLVIGMLPTFTALFTDPAKARTKVVTVGALNLAGCVPFLLELWTEGHSLDRALNTVADPQAIIVMYSAAAIGYLVDWSMSAVVAGVLYQRGLSRQESIKKRQAELVARWGQEVTGQIPLDQYGFPLQQPGKEH